VSVVKGEVPYAEAKGSETIEAHLTLPRTNKSSITCRAI